MENLKYIHKHMCVWPIYSYLFMYFKYCLAIGRCITTSSWPDCLIETSDVNWKPKRYIHICIYGWHTYICLLQELADYWKYIIMSLWPDCLIETSDVNWKPKRYIHICIYGWHTYICLLQELADYWEIHYYVMMTRLLGRDKYQLENPICVAI